MEHVSPGSLEYTTEAYLHAEVRVKVVFACSRERVEGKFSKAIHECCCGVR